MTPYKTLLGNWHASNVKQTQARMRTPAGYQFQSVSVVQGSSLCRKKLCATRAQQAHFALLVSRTSQMLSLYNVPHMTTFL
jgi:hypothetical protein